VKVCKRCKEEKELVQFSKDKREKDNHMLYCKSCEKTRQAVYREKFPEKARSGVKACWEVNRQKYYNSHSANMLFKKYKLTIPQYTDMVDACKGVCSLCERPFGVSAYTKPVVDHCHASGATRGIICRQCNIGLGAFRDNTTSMTKAIEYLNNFNNLKIEKKI